MYKLTAVSLFASGGIGDLALRHAGYRLLVANELLEDRARLLEHNFPETHVIIGDIRNSQSQIIESAKARLGDSNLDLLFATPPCQGMSKNGRGKLLSEVRAGRKPGLDARNELIKNAIHIAHSLAPKLVILENVPEMLDTVIPSVSGDLINIIDLLRKELEDYWLTHRVIEFADYGVPERRQRLITVLVRKDISPSFKPAQMFPAPSHAKIPGLFEKAWVTVNEVIGGLPPLDAKTRESARSKIPYHYVPTLDSDKYFWVSNTPPGSGAFDNQCVNPDCGNIKNIAHGSSHVNGINRSNLSTPLFCHECGEILPRPWVRTADGFKLMKGFTSAYKRMRGDLPASALTRNLSYACSDQKLHPSQNRVLSLKEAFIIHTIDEFSFEWERSDGKPLSDKTIREVIGESVPPAGLCTIVKHINGLLFERDAVVTLNKLDMLVAV